MSRAPHSDEGAARFANAPLRADAGGRIDAHENLSSPLRDVRFHPPMEG